MLRIVQAVQLTFNRPAALVRREGSHGKCPREFIGEAPCITKSSVDQHATQSPSDHAIAVPKANDQPDREKLVRQRWLET